MKFPQKYETLSLMHWLQNCWNFFNRTSRKHKHCFGDTTTLYIQICQPCVSPSFSVPGRAGSRPRITGRHTNLLRPERLLEQQLASKRCQNTLKQLYCLKFY
jgi:hypothetical protein